MKQPKLKYLSAHVPVCLAILAEHRNGAYVEEITAGYEEIGLESDIRTIRNYISRVRKLGLLRTESVREGGYTRSIFHITPEGRKELSWWQNIIAVRK